MLDLSKIPKLKELPPCQNWLDDTAKKIYIKKGNLLIDRNLLTELDLDYLSHLCRIESYIITQRKQGKQCDPGYIKIYNEYCKKMILNPIELIW